MFAGGLVPLTPASVPAEEPIEELARVRRLPRVERVQFFGRLVQQPAKIDDQRNPIMGVLPQQRQTCGAARPRCGASSAQPERPQWRVRTFRHQCPPLARQACARVNRPARPTFGLAWVGSSCQRVFRGLGLGVGGSVGMGACRSGQAGQRRPHEHQRRSPRQVRRCRGASGTGGSGRRHRGSTRGVFRLGELRSASAGRGTARGMASPLGSRYRDNRRAEAPARGG